MKNKLPVFVLIVLFFLGTGIFVFPQNEVSVSEKRNLATNESIKAGDILGGSFSANVENVMKDQFYFRDSITGFYYRLKTILNRYLGSGKSSIDYVYLNENVIELDDGYLINNVLFYNEEDLDIAASKGYNLNEVDLKYPEIKTYVYFPTRMEEILDVQGNSPETSNYGLGYREAFRIQLNPDITYGSLKMENIDDHKAYFYKSDFHWNHRGAYEAYKDIVSMINQDFEIGDPKEIAEEVCYDHEFRGNISSQIGHLGEADHICDYKLNDIGEHTLIADGEETDLADVKREYAESGNNSQYSDYDIYFGNNYFERIFDFHQPERPNILIFADSYTNVYQEWLASHFNKTVILDLRTRPEDFSLDYYIQEYDIDIFLIAQPYHDLFFNGDMFIPLN